MVTATFLVIIFSPLFYVLIEKTFGKRRKGETDGSSGANRFFQVLMERIRGKFRKGEATGTAGVTPPEER